MRGNWWAISQRPSWERHREASQNFPSKSAVCGNHLDWKRNATGCSLLSTEWDDGLAQVKMWLDFCSWERTEFRLIAHVRWVSEQFEDPWEQRPSVLRMLLALALAYTRGRLKNSSVAFHSLQMMPYWGVHCHPQSAAQPLGHLLYTHLWDCLPYASCLPASARALPSTK